MTVPAGLVYNHLVSFHGIVLSVTKCLEDDPRVIRIFFHHYKTLSSAEICFNQVFKVTSQQSLESLLGLCGNQDEQIGHSIASKALMRLSLVLLNLKERPCWRKNRTDQERRTCNCLRLVHSGWHVSDLLVKCTCCCSTSLVGPSDLGGLDSSERMPSFRVSRAGGRAFRGQV